LASSALLGMLVPAAARAAPGGVELLRSGPSLIHFFVDVPPPVFMPGPEGSDAPGWVSLSLAGYETAGFPGEPALPLRILQVAVPPHGKVLVRAGAAGTRVFDGVVLAPQPAVDRGAEGHLRYVRSPEAYAVRGSRLPERARLLDVSWMRNQRVARVAVTPADYDAASARLTVWSRVDVEVEVEPAGEVGAPAESPDPFERVYRKLLVNYEQGGGWRRPAHERLAGRLLEADGLFSAAAAETNSVFPGRDWIKIPVTRTGFYKVEFGQIRSLDPIAGDTTIPLDSLRLMTWPGVPVLPEGSYCDSCDFREVAIGVVDDGDGVFNHNTDAIYFFALGSSDWADLYDPAQPDTVFLNNPYETRSFYYLTVSTADNPVPGPFRRIRAESGAPAGGGATPATFGARVHEEVDVPAQYYPDLTALGTTYSWEKWFWHDLTSGRSVSLSTDTPGVETSLPARLRMRLWGINPGERCPAAGVFSTHVVDLALNGADVGRFGWDAVDVTVSVRPLIRAVVAAYTVDTAVTGLRASGNMVQLKVAEFSQCPGRDDHVALAWFDVFYARRFEPVGDELAFDTPAESGTYLYRIGPFRRAVPPRVFDVTDPCAPKEIISFAYDPVDATYRLSFEAGQAGRRHFRIVQDSSIVRVPTANVSAAQPTSLVNLRSRALRADYLVIFYDGFAAAAESLATWRREGSQYESLAVPISALYDQYSGGRTDPAAIRNFLRTTFRWEKTPTFVTLLGDASFDFKNYLGYAGAGQPGTLLPSYENNYDAQLQQQYASDDWLLNVDDARVVVPDFFGGRIPAADAPTALDIVRNKVLLYERAALEGEFRNRVLFIADDDRQGAALDPIGWRHLAQTTILDTLFTPSHIDRSYVYLHTYDTTPGNTKPEAKADIERAINEDGVLMCNYIGHGSSFQLSDERVFLATDVGALTNAARLPVFIAASCDVGRYNDPRVQSLGERLLVQPGGGAIGVISATGEAFSGQNAQLNDSLYADIFQREPSGFFHVPFSEALISGKSGSTNSQKYQLLGDAATRPALPRYWVEVTLWDSAGRAPLTALRQGQTALVRGRVVDRPGPAGALVPLDGVAGLLIEDSPPRDRAPNCPGWPGCPYCPPGAPPDSCQVYYYLSAGPIYRGDVSMNDGVFEGRFVVPLDVGMGARGRARAYAYGRRLATAGETDAVGSVSVPVGAGTAAAGDSEGPRITLAFAGGSTSVRPDALLKVLLYDPSGILSTGHSLQNGIVVTVDENTTRREDISSSFRYAADSYQSGTASYRLPDLPAGPHRIRVSAADNLAAGLSAGVHRSSATIDFEVSEAPPLRIAGAYLFPNPTRSGGPQSGGQFVIDAPGDSINVLLRIYAVSGRLLRELKAFAGLGQMQIPWDGRDEEGADLANGVYLFRVHVNGRERDGSSSARQEAVADGRFVIVNR
jgi:hypothetical protein